MTQSARRTTALALCLVVCLASVTTPPPATAAVTGLPGAAPNPVLEIVVTGLEEPLFAGQAGDGSGRLFIVERAGRIRIFKDGTLAPTPFLDIDSNVGSSDSEQGLLGLAFHPSYSANGLIYLDYTDNSGDKVVSRFQVSSDPDVVDPGSETVLLTIDQPASNHNGGMLAFGQDGYLYIGTGDGGGAGDPSNNAQNITTLLGKILRIDVDSAAPYAIPGGNPYAGNPDPFVKKEIWAFGLRNPWRFSFDRITGDLFIGDVGQGSREEIDFQPASSTGGENYGWRDLEGSQCYNAPTCDSSGMTMPVTEYDHGGSGGCSVTGGYVYRGWRSPQLEGVYLYGDFCTGRIWGLTGDSQGNWSSTLLLDTSFDISSFGEGEDGEIYLTNYSGGRLLRILLPSAPKRDTAGIRRGDRFDLRTSNTIGIADVEAVYGLTPDVPLIGDWDGGGVDTIGTFRAGVFYLRNSNSTGYADLTFGYGLPGDTPIAGDWDRDGLDTVGVFRGGIVYLRNSNTTGYADVAFGYGLPGDIPVAGDWDGDGVDTVGVFRNGVFYLRNSNSTGYADVTFRYGLPGDRPIVGDWDGDGVDTVATFRSGVFYLRNSNTSGFADVTFGYGLPGDTPLAGDWDGLP